MIGALVAACGPTLLDRHTDPDHHRSVLTLAGPGPTDASTAVRDLARAVAVHCDLGRGSGVHPRLGALDVVPFVALDGTDATAVAEARRFAAWIADELAVPTFLYDAADPLGRSLPEARRQAFVTRPPDHGPAAPHPTLGAVAVGARQPLVAVNCWLDTDDLSLARSVARAVRERDGGLPGLRALGLALASRGTTQVSMNVVDPERCPVETACTEVRRRVEAEGHTVTRVELVGLIPDADYSRCSPEFLAWAGWTPDVTIGSRLRARAGG